MRKYFYRNGNKKHGPFLKNELKEQKLSRNTKVWFYGLDDWVDLGKVEELKDILKSIPPEIKPPIKNTSSTSDNIAVKDVSATLNENQTKTSNFTQKKIFTGVILLVFILLIIFSTFKNVNNNLHNDVIINSYDSNGEFDIYVEKFFRDLEVYGIYPQRPKEMIIKFSNLDQIKNTTHVHGISFGKDNDEKVEIYINGNTWKNFNKPLRYFLIYHELAHDILNLDDTSIDYSNEGKLMFPMISSYENKNMDDFIESFHHLFEKLSFN